MVLFESDSVTAFCIGTALAVTWWIGFPFLCLQVACFDSTARRRARSVGLVLVLLLLATFVASRWWSVTAGAGSMNLYLGKGRIGYSAASWHPTGLWITENDEPGHNFDWWFGSDSARISICMIALVTAMPVSAMFMWQRQKRGTCSRCGYILVGGEPQERCTECGASAHAIDQMMARRRRGAVRVLSGGLCLGSTIVAGSHLHARLTSRSTEEAARIRSTPPAPLAVVDHPSIHTRGEAIDAATKYLQSCELWVPNYRVCAESRMENTCMQRKWTVHYSLASPPLHIAVSLAGGVIRFDRIAFEREALAHHERTTLNRSHEFAARHQAR